MGNRNADVSYFTFEQRFHLVNVLNAIVDDKNLPISAHLIVDGLFHHLHIECVNLRLYRITVGGRRVYGGKIARTHQRELQRARNGCGGHRERIDVSF